MERRSAERYMIDLQADAACALPNDGNRKSKVKIRDISSIGAAFYDAQSWRVGDPVSMVIHFQDGIVGPFTYNLRVRGRVVRKDFEELHGKACYAVAFEKHSSLSDWTEVETSAMGTDQGTSSEEAEQ